MEKLFGVKPRLYKEINMARKDMIESVNLNGIGHPNTIQLSQRLDNLIVQYQMAITSTSAETLNIAR